MQFEILSNPEFLAEGTAIEDLTAPDRVLIGGKDTESGRAAIATLARCGLGVGAAESRAACVLSMPCAALPCLTCLCSCPLLQRVRALGAQGPHPVHQPVVCGAVQADRQRHAGAAHLLCQLHLRPVRGNWCVWSWDGDDGEGCDRMQLSVPARPPPLHPCPLCPHPPAGADVQQVARAIGTDSRIGPKFLNASVGFGGSCFQKDILNLVYICETVGLQQVAEYWNQVRSVGVGVMSAS